VAALLGMQVSVPTIRILGNPHDPYGKVLAIAGEDEKQLLSAAQAFAFGAYTPEGDRAELSNLALPPRRKPYDAPSRLQTDRLVLLTQTASDSDLQAAGGGVVNLYFRLPPDLYYGVRDTVPLHLRYRCSQMSKAGKAAVNVQLNGIFAASRQIPMNSMTDLHEEIIMLPAAALYPRNTLSVEFAFDHVRLQSGAGGVPQAAVLRGTELLIRGISHFTRMPRLDIFATTGFPFTRMADLSETIVALPASPRPDELSLYLNLLGFMGAETGYPALRVAVLEGGTPPAGTDKDILILGTYDDQPLLKEWAAWMPVQPEGDRFRLVSPVRFGSYWELAPFTDAAKDRRVLKLLFQGDAALQGILQGFRSPLNPDRSVVSLSAPAGRKLDALADAWASAGDSVKVQGGITLLYGDEFRSYAISMEPYHLGKLGTWQSFQYWSRRYYWFMPILVFGCIWFLAVMIDRWLEARAAARLQLQQ
jgi:cellulose synthase (UDP-forming)